MSFLTNFQQVATTPARRLALELVEAAIRAASPALLLGQQLRVRDTTLLVRGRRFSLKHGRVWVLGAGKASTAMAQAVEALLGPQRIAGGLVITGPSPVGPRPQKIRVREGDHPVPGPASLEATQELLAVADQVASGDLVLWVISGGASAMLVAPASGITLAEKQAVTQALLASGATIDEINTVRKHLSAVKGGLLARRLAPARVLTLALSDVVSGKIDVIGSGPTVPDPTTHADALQVVERHQLRSKVPASVQLRLEAGARGELPETPKAGDPYFARSYTRIIGGPKTTTTAAARKAMSVGLPTGQAGVVHVQVLSDQLEGEARTAARVLGSILRYHSKARAGRPRVLVLAGETTVTVTGTGKGGRCQELAAALIPEIAGLPDCAVVCAATDGQDYLEGIGGAIVDGETAAKAATLGLQVESYLRAHDSYSLHSPLGTLLETEATGTNVCDLIVCVLGAG